VPDASVGGSQNESIPSALLRQHEVGKTDARKPPADALAAISLGDNLLELGPGPGPTTLALARIAPRVTAVEIDRELAKWRAGNRRARAATSRWSKGMRLRCRSMTRGSARSSA
jgi:hypothetical protein